MRTLLSIAPFLSLACSQQDVSSQPPIQRWDSAGVEIVQSNHPIEDDGMDWDVAERPTLTISTHPTGEEPVIHWTRGVARLSDGRIAVLSESGKNLLLFSSAGDLLRTIGRAGGGPGEFTSPFQLTRLQGDTLVVTERRATRISWFSAEGAFLWSVTPDRENIVGRVPEGHTIVEPSTFISPGRILWLLAPPFERRVGERWRAPTVFVLTDETGEGLVTLTELPGYERFTLDEDFGWMALFPRQSHTAHGHGPHEILIGDSGDFSLQVFSTDGRLKRIIRDAVPPEAVTVSDIEREKAALLDWGRRAGDSPKWARFADEVPIPDRKPGFEQLIFDSEGYLWAKGYSNSGMDPIRYRVFDPSGSRVATVTMPGRFRVFDIGYDYVLGVAYDSNSVETIQMYSLERG